MPPFKSQFIAACILCLLLPLPQTLQGQDELALIAREKEFAQLAEEVALLEFQSHILRKVARLARPSVVHIEAEKAKSESARYRSHVEESGAGIIVAHGKGHYVITNHHVIKGANHHDITINLADGRRYQPNNKWHDPDSDIAVMEISGSSLIPARIGDSDQLDIGDFVMAMGSPFGLSHSATFGIVSAKGRRDLKLGDEQVRLQDFIQTDAAINPGNSGGPLLNLHGKVVGMNTAIASNSGGNEGIGFAIPIKMVMTIAEQLIEEQGKIRRAFLGVQLDRDFNPVDAARLGISQPMGARVSGVNNHSPAAAAQLQIDDVITRINNVHIEDDGHLINVIGLTPVGTEIEIELTRKGKSVVVSVVVDVRNN